MNPGTQKEAVELFEAVKNGVKNAKAEVVVCPPFVYVSSFKLQASGIKLGAQNVSLEPKGAFTSQVSAAQLKDLGVEYVIVGHSESRKHLHETNEEISQKIKIVLETGMKPILCIDNEKQIPKGLSSDVIIAYEPLWAIGTGKSCEPSDVQKMAGVIKDLAGDVKILYGGSVNSQNAKAYLAVVNGLLVGGASLKAEEFVKIVESASV